MNSVAGLRGKFALLSTPFRKYTLVSARCADTLCLPRRDSSRRFFAARKLRSRIYETAYLVLIRRTRFGAAGCNFELAKSSRSRHRDEEGSHRRQI